MTSVYVGKFDCMKDCSYIQHKLDDYGIKGYIFHVDGKYSIKTYTYPSRKRALPFMDLLKYKGFPDVFSKEEGDATKRDI